MKKLKNIILEKSILFIGFIWVFQNLFSFLQYGIESSYEATKYIEQANHLIATGQYTSKNFIFYSVQIILIATSIKLKSGFILVIAIQLLLNAISTYLLFCIIHEKSKSRLLATTGTIFFLLMHYYHLYNFYLFTESIFFSLSIIYTYFLFSLRHLNFKKGIGITLFLALLYLTRPVGIFFIPATLAFLLIKFRLCNLINIILLATVLFSILFYKLLNFSLSSGGGLDFLLPYSNEMVICGVATIETENSIHIPVEKNSIKGLLYITTHHLDLFIKLSTKRFIAFFGLVRPYYSTLHNIYIAIYFYTMYLLILAGITSTIKKYKPEVIFIGILIFCITITVMLSCDEWHNRFIFGLLPFFIILSTFSLSKQNTLYSEDSIK